MEAVLTFSLPFAVYVVDPRRTVGGVGPLLCRPRRRRQRARRGGPFSGASMHEPRARSFGPALAAGVWADHWVCWVGPLIGGPLAGLVYDGLFMAHGGGHEPLPPRGENDDFEAVASSL
jgi:aquaporin TIP